MKPDQLIISHEPNNLNLPFNLPNNDLEPQSNRQIKQTPTKLRSDNFLSKQEGLPNQHYVNCRLLRLTLRTALSSITCFLSLFGP